MQRVGRQRMKSALVLLRHAAAAHKVALISLSIFVVIAASYAAVADVRDPAIVSLRAADLYADFAILSQGCAVYLSTSSHLPPNSSMLRREMSSWVQHSRRKASSAVVTREWPGLSISFPFYVGHHHPNHIPPQGPPPVTKTRVPSNKIVPVPIRIGAPIISVSMPVITMVIMMIQSHASPSA
jgi:hypothetical protein